MVRRAMPLIRSTSSSPGGQAVMDRQRLRSPYPNGRVIVLDDDHNTFQHVVEVLVKYIPAMSPDRAWELAHRIDSNGAAEVWSGPLEQAELHHQQLAAEGLNLEGIRMVMELEEEVAELRRQLAEQQARQTGGQRGEIVPLRQAVVVFGQRPSIFDRDRY